MRPAPGTPRLLLRRLREIMAEPESAQRRLDEITVLIAGNMVAEVCSIYVRLPDGALELFATEGLNPDAVHKTFLKIGEGLVGLIAADAIPLNLPDAPNHPAFAFRPETGEETYPSFLGVPILRSGHVLGVLCVQNHTRRHYTDEEVEALQTTAMVIAELIASGALETLDDATQDISHRHPHRLVGVRLNDGLALGHAVLHEPRITVSKFVAEDADEEMDRLNAAIEKLRLSIDKMLVHADVARTGEHHDVLEAFRMFAYDRGWAARMREAISTGLTAEAAVERVRSDTRAQMLRQTDPYIRERLHDFDDLSNRLLRVLTGGTMRASSEGLPEDAILIARNMGPADLLDYDRARLRGLILEEATPFSHVAIVARALDLPAVGQATGVLDLIEPGDPVIADGEAGEVHLRPPVDVERAYVEKVRFRARRQEQYARLRDKPAVSRDGRKVDLMINAGLLVDLPHLEESGASGIGLFRTELQFMISAVFPRLNQQTGTYGAIFEAANGKPVVFRTLDIGGDKMLPYLKQVPEENPALGWRAIRMGLDRPGLFRTQMRALLRAAAGRELHIMFPMITELDEIKRAKAYLNRELELLDGHGFVRPERLAVGAMIEVPAILWQLDDLMGEVDFLSVGTNDLHQFLFASDRGSPRLTERFDALSPVNLRVLHMIAEKAEAHGVPVSICGEMAGMPLEAMALFGLGYRTISMAPAALGAVKAMLLQLDIAEFEIWLLAELESSEKSLRGSIKAYAHKAGVPV